jgi:phage host-nuclease inhibitor protein Gam
MGKKSKPTIPFIRSREELEAAMTDYAEKAARLRGLTAGLDVALAAVREAHAAAITAAGEALEPSAAALEEWAALNPGAFEGKKSVDLLSGRIGFRTSPPAVKLMSRVKEETAVSLLLDGELGAAYTREEVTLDKEAILAAFAEKAVTNE